MHLNWNSIALASWKRGPWKKLIDHGYLIWYSPELRKQEIQPLKQAFHEKNDYPKWIINQVAEQVKAKHGAVTHSNNLPRWFWATFCNNWRKKPFGITSIPRTKKWFYVIVGEEKTSLPNNFNTHIAFKGKKLNSCFKIKDTVNFEHKHDLAYHGKCPANKCNDDYVGETVRRISERITDHYGRDVNSYLSKYHMVKEHPRLQNKDFVVLYTLVILL